MKPVLTASQEDYLEAIYLLEEADGAARAAAVARKIGVRKPSVTTALRSLTAAGLVAHDPYGAVRLTRRGRDAARGVVRRHRVLMDFLTSLLGVAQREAEEVACRMEHALSAGVLRRLDAHVRRHAPGGTGAS